MHGADSVPGGMASAAYHGQLKIKKVRNKDLHSE